ncbi:MAG: glutathione S-transferase, partial [Gammaproteobacteria bacterium]|nr:glutathione S-transferase [Gammaproteobacteria bacterium]
MATLIIGNKNYSSWSLRPWLLLKEMGIEFDEIMLQLDSEEFQQRIGDYSPARRVPVLRHNDHVIWDSLAIAEYLNDAFPEKQLWPKEVKARILARAVTCEMHSGFSALRQSMPMN